MRWRIAIVAAVLAFVVAGGCGHDAKRDVVADARTSLDGVHRGTVHVQLGLAAGSSEPRPSTGFAMDGTFDLAPAGAVRSASDVTTVNLGTPDDLPAHFLSTGRDAFVVRGDVGYQLTPAQVASLSMTTASASTAGLPSIDLHASLIDPRAQPRTSTAAGEVVDRVTGRIDPVVAVNGAVDLADQLGAGPDAALRISPADAARVRGATTSSTVEVLTGGDDHLMRSLTAHVELSMPTPTSSTPAGPTTGGAVVQALHKLGHVTVTVEVRLDHPNAPVAISPPPTIRPFSELGSG